MLTKHYPLGEADVFSSDIIDEGLRATPGVRLVQSTSDIRDSDKRNFCL